jgi:serralysin
MATPTTNSVGVTYIDPAATGIGRYIADGEKWGGGLGTGVTLTYSFPRGSANFITPYGNSFGNGEWDHWHSLSDGERTAVRKALAAWASVANLTFVEVADNSSNVGELRFTYTEVISDTAAAHAYLPSGSPEAGDVWFSWDNFNSNGLANIAVGSDDFQTILHEIGHALGLKHSFESPNAIPAQHDSYFYTLMSYTASPWTDSNFATFFPTTPMYYDLAAIQALYGRNTSHNAGNTTYTFNGASTYFLTIDDAGGIDKIVYNGTPGCIINLTIGTFSSVGKSIGFGGGHSSRSTVCIGPGSVIESAVGGAGSDTLNGNPQANTLVGQGGNDVLKGNAGNDILNGGAGKDTLGGGAGLDIFVFNAALSQTSNVDHMIDFNHTNDTVRLDNAVFTKLQAANGPLAPGAFHIGPGAHDANDRIIYNGAQGVLYYDPDGIGGAPQIKFATLGTKLPVNGSDFFVI